MDETRFTHNGNSTPFVAVSIQRTHHCGLHVGLVYRYRRKLRRLHFAWHRTLKIEDYAASPVACSIPQLDEADAMWLAKYFQRIAKHPANRLIPYNLKHDGQVAFHEQTGELIMGADSTGLGCATFVVAAFRSAGHCLVDPAGWPPATSADIDRRRILIRALLTSPDKEQQQQGAKILKELDSACIAPNHVAGACLEDREAWPVGHAACDPNGKRVLELLDAGPPA